MKQLNLNLVRYAVKYSKVGHGNVPENEHKDKFRGRKIKCSWSCLHSRLKLFSECK